MPFLKVGSWCIIAVAIITLTLSLIVYRHTQHFVQTASHTSGIVSKLNSRDGEKELYPLFSFKDSRGTTHSVESLSGSYPAAYKVGDTVAVIYQTDKPDNAEIDSFLNIWIWPIALAGFSTLVFLFGLGMFVMVGVLQKSQRKTTIAHTDQEATLEISFPKALLVSSVGMVIFFVGNFIMGAFVKDPLFIGFVIVIGVVMPFVFAGCLCFMLRCKIGHDGLRPAVPTFYQWVLRWEDISYISRLNWPFYSIRCRGLSRQCLLPRPFLLKRPDTLRKCVRQYAPPDNIVRQTLDA